MFQNRKAGKPGLVTQYSPPVVEACERVVHKLHRELQTREVSCVLRSDEGALRNVANVSDLRVVYEIPRDWGGVLWRAVEDGTTQFVPDVKSDPDYLAQDESIQSEIAVPIRAGTDVVGALNVECRENMDEGDVAAVERAADELGHELERLAVFSTRT